MLRLLSLEWKKNRRNNTFRVLLLLYILLLPGLYLVGKALPDMPSEMGGTGVLYMFPTVWTYLGYTGNWLVFFFFGFLSVLSVTTEFNYRTLRQNVITGLTRSELFWAKCSHILALSLFATIYYAIVAMTFGFMNTETIYWSKVWQEVGMIPRYFMMCMGYTSFGLLLGLLIRRTGMVLFLYVSYVMFLELIWRWLVHKNIFASKTMHFYPMNAIEDLTPFPLMTVPNEFSKGMDFDLFLSPTEAMMTTGVYVLLFLWGSFQLLKRKAL